MLVAIQENVERSFLSRYRRGSAASCFSTLATVGSHHNEGMGENMPDAVPFLSSSVSLSGDAMINDSHDMMDLDEIKEENPYPDDFLGSDTEVTFQSVERNTQSPPTQEKTLSAAMITPEKRTRAKVEMVPTAITLLPKFEFTVQEDMEGIMKLKEEDDVTSVTSECSGSSESCSHVREEDIHLQYLSSLQNLVDAMNRSEHTRAVVMVQREYYSRLYEPFANDNHLLDYYTEESQDYKETRMQLKQQLFALMHD